ncbi:hypothetical protein GCM10023235_50480 [Kitasatospora terrestris]|uniref:Uncharacterized protein n=1 Tax=Kitasatospora terrestris TaxID=258051 RepID=A0ABP9E326_9ACTN
MSAREAGAGQLVQDGWAEALAARLGERRGPAEGEAERAAAVGAQAAGRRASRPRTTPPVPAWARRVAESGGFDVDGSSAE